MPLPQADPLVWIYLALMALTFVLAVAVLWDELDPDNPKAEPGFMMFSIVVGSALWPLTWAAGAMLLVAIILTWVVNMAKEAFHANRSS